MKRGVVARREWTWAALVGASIMLFTTIPYLVAVAAQNEAWRFGGFVLGVEDGNSYLAKMAQGARGAWLFRLAYSSEPQRGVFMFLFHLVLGKLAGPGHSAQVLAYHAARVVLGLALLLVSYRFLAEFLPAVRQRRLAFVLVALGGGLGWLLLLMGQAGAFGSLPLDFYSPEAFSFLVLYALPHLALARILLLLGLLAFVRRRGAVAGLALFGVSVIQPLYVLVAWLVMAAAAALEVAWCSLPRLRAWLPAPAGWAQPRRTIAAGAVAGLLSAPVVVYTIAVFAADPVLRQWNAQNVLPSPHPVHYLLAYGLLLVPAVLGWRCLWRREPRLAAFALGWLVLAPVLVALPIPTQRRLIEGAQLPLVALAVLGLTLALRRWRWLKAAVLALSLPGTLLLWLGGLAAARVPAEPVFHPASQVAAFDWLAGNGQPGQVALSAYPTGNALPAYTPLTAYIGHGPETVFLAQKAPRVARFYGALTPDSERRALLAEGRIAFVIFGPHERALGDFDPATVGYLAPRFAAGDYAIFAVAP